MKEPYVVVVGGANVDIGGSPAKPLVAADSNPGTVTVTMGGVGRNIAESMARQGIPVVLLTGLGQDVYGDAMRRSCAALGIDTSHCTGTPDGRSSTYLYINDHTGDMALAIADMKTESCVTADYLKQELDLMDHAAAVVADANISAEAMAYLAGNLKVPLFVDPVSTAKAVRITDAMGGIFLLKPNRLEAETLTGIRINDETALRAAAAALLERGVKNVCISCGNEGVLAASRAGMKMIPCGRIAHCCTTGAGDAFVGALVKAYLDGKDLYEATEYAIDYAVGYLTECKVLE